MPQMFPSVPNFINTKDTEQHFPSRSLPLASGHQQLRDFLYWQLQLDYNAALDLHLPSVCLNTMSFCGLPILSQEGLNYSLRLFFLPFLLKICFRYYRKKKLKTNRFDSSIHNKPLDGYLMRMCISGIIKQSRSPNQHRLVRQEILHFLQFP